MKEPETQSYYSLLGVERTASREEIRRAFKQVVPTHHPDHGGDEAAFLAVQTAYEVLVDPRKRRIYDRFGQSGLEKSAVMLFTQEFRRGSFSPAPEATKDLQVEVEALRRKNESLQRQLMIVKPDHENPFAGSFESWLRNRDPGSLKVITPEVLAEQLGVSEESYTPVPLPPLETWQVEHTELGEMSEVVHRGQRPLPAALKWGEVLVHFLAAPLSAIDRHLARWGFIPKLTAPKHPFVVGAEGVGLVLRVGPGVKDLAVRDLVLPRTPLLGTWRRLAVAKESGLYRLPSTTLAPEALASFFSFGTAYRLLEDYGALLPGDTLIQSNADSAVGRAVIQLCRLLQIKTINLVEDRGDFEAVADVLNGLGATHVWKNVGSIEERLRRSNAALPRLALDATGGNTLHRLAETLRPEGTLVTYGSNTSKVEPFPYVPLLYHNIELRGFWLYRWLQERPDGFNEMTHVLLPLLEEGQLENSATLWSNPDQQLSELLRHHGPSVIHLGTAEEALALATRLDSEGNSEDHPRGE
jgi:mitochondrial enoyl-[acyl-carrier protein] reductase / trans-2-enoyl-CoA reductase